MSNQFRKFNFSLVIMLHTFFFSIAQREKVQVNITNPQDNVEIIGKLGKKLGTVMTVRGVIVEGPNKGYEQNLLVQMINDSSVQQTIMIPFSPFFREFGEKPIPEVQEGASYLFRVYETGEFTGVPDMAYKEIGEVIQTTNFHFRNWLVIISGEKINPIEWSPGDFLNRNALLSGIANNEGDTAVILSAIKKLMLIGFRKWETSETGKQAEVFGKVKQTDVKNVFLVENGHARLVNLEDQIGKTVRLRGRAINLNQYWWFKYRGTDLYVENLEGLPGWSVDNHFRAIEITGILEQAQLPAIDQFWEKKPDIKLQFIVRKASWAPISGLLSPEL